MVVRDSRQVYELKVNVLVGEHAGLGELRRKRIRAGLRRGPGEARMQR